MLILINGRFLTRPKTGVERVAYNYTRCLLTSRIKTNIRIVVPSNVDIRSDIYTEASHFPLLPYGKLYKFLVPLGGHFWEQVFLYRLARARKAFLINFANTAPILYKKQLVLIHDAAFVDVPSTFKKSFTLLYRFLIPRILSHSKAIFTVSYFSKSRLETLCKKCGSKIHVIHNGITPLQQKPKSLTYREILLKKETNKRYITFIGSITNRKNINNLVKGFLLANQRKPNLFRNIYLLLIGKKGKAFRLDLPNDALFSNKVIFAGYVPDTKFKSYLDNTILGVNVSLYEGFNLPPGEMLLSNIPVLLSGIPVNREIYGDIAVYSDPYDIEDIAQKFIYALSNYPKMIKKIRTRINEIKKYNWNNSCKKLVNLTKKLV